MDIAKVVLKNLPSSVKGFTCKNVDETYTIFLNSRLSKKQNQKTYLHEIGHIENGDFYSTLQADQIEKLRHNYDCDDTILDFMKKVSFGQMPSLEHTQCIIYLLQTLLAQVKPIVHPNSDIQDLYELVQKENILLKYYDLPGNIKGIYFNDKNSVITLDESLLDCKDIYLHRCILAEQLGHHFTSTTQLYCAANFPFWKISHPKKKTQALRWSAFYLIDYNKLKTAIEKYSIHSICDLAEHFCVTKELMLFRLQFLRKNDFLKLDELLWL